MNETLSIPVPPQIEAQACAAGDALTVAELRAESGLTLLEFGEKIFLSKSQMHEVERANRASLRVALAIETLSMVDGMPRIDAADLNDDVRQARHTAAITSDPAPPATGQKDELSGERPFETGKRPPQGERERVA